MPPIKPHWGWFLLGPVILVLGCIAAVVIFFVGLFSIAEGMQHVDVPGSGTVQVDRVGKLPVFYEQRSSGAPPLALEVRITPAAGGDPVPIDTSDTNFSYTANEWTGRQWGTAQIPAPGQYKVETMVPIGTPPGRLAVGGNAEEKLVMTLLGVFGLPFVSFLLCMLIVVIVAIKRSGYRKRMLREQYAHMAPTP